MKNKLHETLDNMQNLFDNDTNNDTGDIPDNTPNNNIPDPDDIHKHINSLLGGKLGTLAMELAEETASSLNIDPNSTGDASEVFQDMFKNPGKLMNMVKNVGDKIDTKLKSGEIKESELLSEGMDLLSKMQNMPGMGNIQEMCQQMGIPMPPGMNKNSKVNTGAMQSKLSQEIKIAQMKERMKNKIDKKQDIKTNVTIQPTVSEEEILNIFSTGEDVARTPRGTKAPIDTKKKKKKNKK